MKYQVPQFIEVEDKIFGPLTLKQFIYIAGGAGLSVVIYLFLPLLFAIIFIFPVMVFSLMLAFYKYNNKPFIFLIESAFKYYIGSKLYLWRKEEPAIANQNNVEQPIDNSSSAFIPQLSNSRLKDLTWSLDTKGSLNPVTKGNDK